MAAKRMIARQKRRAALQGRFETRSKLKEIIKNPNSTPEEVFAAGLSLQKRRVDESPVRSNNICLMCGRPKGVFKRFGLCRCCLRKMALAGLIPGLQKASW